MTSKLTTKPKGNLNELLFQVFGGALMGLRTTICQMGRSVTKLPRHYELSRPIAQRAINDRSS